MMAQFQIGELIMFRIVRAIVGGLLLVLLGVFGPAMAAPAGLGAAGWERRLLSPSHIVAVGDMVAAAVVTGAAAATGVVAVATGPVVVIGLVGMATVATSMVAITSTAAATRITHIMTTIIATITTTRIIPTVTIAGGIVHGSARTTSIPGSFGAV